MKLLIIEQDAAIAASLKHLLMTHKFPADTATNGISDTSDTSLAGRPLCQNPYDVILIRRPADTLPCPLIRQLRSQHCSALILLLALDAYPQSRVEGLESGADYCLSAPLEPLELVACIRALLRRQGKLFHELSYGNTVLDLGACSLRCGESTIRLSAKEYDVMRLLMQAAHRNLSKETILAQVWGYDSSAVENHVEVYVGFLRKKLKAIGSDIRIKAIRNLGYHLELED